MSESCVDDKSNLDDGGVTDDGDCEISGATQKPSPLVSSFRKSRFSSDFSQKADLPEDASFSSMSSLHSGLSAASPDQLWRKGEDGKHRKGGGKKIKTDSSSVDSPTSVGSLRKRFSTKRSISFDVEDNSTTRESCPSRKLPSKSKSSSVRATRSILVNASQEVRSNSVRAKRTIFDIAEESSSNSPRTSPTGKITTRRNSADSMPPELTSRIAAEIQHRRSSTGSSSESPSPQRIAVRLKKGELHKQLLDGTASGKVKLLAPFSGKESDRATRKGDPIEPDNQSAQSENSSTRSSTGGTRPKKPIRTVSYSTERNATGSRVAGAVKVFSAETCGENEDRPRRGLKKAKSLYFDKAGGGSAGKKESRKTKTSSRPGLKKSKSLYLDRAKRSTDDAKETRKTKASRPGLKKAKSVHIDAAEGNTQNGEETRKPKEGSSRSRKLHRSSSNPSLVSSASSSIGTQQSTSPDVSNAPSRKMKRSKSKRKLKEDEEESLKRTSSQKSLRSSPSKDKLLEERDTSKRNGRDESSTSLAECEKIPTNGKSLRRTSSGSKLSNSVSEADGHNRAPVRSSSKSKLSGQTSKLQRSPSKSKLLDDSSSSNRETRRNVSRSFSMRSHQSDASSSSNREPKRNVSRSFSIRSHQSDASSKSASSKSESSRRRRSPSKSILADEKKVQRSSSTTNLDQSSGPKNQSRSGSKSKQSDSSIALESEGSVDPLNESLPLRSSGTRSKLKPERKWPSDPQPSSEPLSNSENTNMKEGVAEVPTKGQCSAEKKGGDRQIPSKILKTSKYGAATVKQGDNADNLKSIPRSVPRKKVSSSKPSKGERSIVSLPDSRPKTKRSQRIRAAHARIQRKSQHAASPEPAPKTSSSSKPFGDDKSSPFEMISITVNQTGGSIWDSEPNRGRSSNGQGQTMVGKRRKSLQKVKLNMKNIEKMTQSIKAKLQGIHASDASVSSDQTERGPVIGPGSPNGSPLDKKGDKRVVSDRVQQFEAVWKRHTSKGSKSLKTSKVTMDKMRPARPGRKVVYALESDGQRRVWRRKSFSSAETQETPKSKVLSDPSPRLRHEFLREIDILLSTQLHLAATRIQALVRGSLLRSRFENGGTQETPRVTSSTPEIQPLVERSLASLLFSSNESRTLIRPSFIRGHWKLRDLHQDLAATKMQTMVRGKLDRLHYRLRQLEIKLSKINSDKQHQLRQIKNESDKALSKMKKKQRRQRKKYAQEREEIYERAQLAMKLTDQLRIDNNKISVQNDKLRRLMLQMEKVNGQYERRIALHNKNCVTLSLHMNKMEKKRNELEAKARSYRSQLRKHKGKMLTGMMAINLEKKQGDLFKTTTFSIMDLVKERSGSDSTRLGDILKEINESRHEKAKSRSGKNETEEPSGKEAPTKLETIPVSLRESTGPPVVEVQSLAPEATRTEVEDSEMDAKEPDKEHEITTSAERSAGTTTEHGEVKGLESGNDIIDATQPKEVADNPVSGTKFTGEADSETFGDGHITEEPDQKPYQSGVAPTPTPSTSDVTAGVSEAGEDEGKSHQPDAATELVCGGEKDESMLDSVEGSRLDAIEETFDAKASENIVEPSSTAMEAIGCDTTEIERMNESIEELESPTLIKQDVTAAPDTISPEEELMESMVMLVEDDDGELVEEVVASDEDGEIVEEVVVEEEEKDDDEEGFLLELYNYAADDASDISDVSALDDGFNQEIGIGTFADEVADDKELYEKSQALLEGRYAYDPNGESQRLMIEAEDVSDDEISIEDYSLESSEYEEVIEDDAYSEMEEEEFDGDEDSCASSIYEVHSVIL